MGKFFLTIIAAGAIWFSFASFNAYYDRHNTVNSNFCKLDTIVIGILTDSVAQITKKQAEQYRRQYLAERQRFKRYVTAVAEVAPCHIHYKFPPNVLKP